MKTRILGLFAPLLLLPVGVSAETLDPSSNTTNNDQTVRPQDVLRTVIDAINPPRTGPDWSRAADLGPYLPEGTFGRRLSIIANYTPDRTYSGMQLYFAQPRAAITAEFPFRINAPGVNRLTFDCELLDIHLPDGLALNLSPRNPNITRAAVRHSFAIQGSGNGNVRIAFAPFQPLAAPEPGYTRTAACAMEASGVHQGKAWRSTSSQEGPFAIQTAPKRVFLVEDATGQLVQPADSITDPVTMAFAVSPN